MFVNLPATVGLRYKTSPSDHDSPCRLPLVLMRLTRPNVVTKPSSLLLLFSVTRPSVSTELLSLFA